MKPEYEALKQSRRVAVWLEAGSEKSERMKLRWLRLYCQFLGLTPDLIIEQPRITPEGN